MSGQEVSKVGWGFGLEWVLATFIGTVVGFQVSIGLKLIRLWDLDLTSLFVSTFCVGALVGMMQWFTLRRQASGTDLWIVANAIGWPVSLSGSLVGVMMLSGGHSIPVTPQLFVTAIISGLVVGMIQVQPITVFLRHRVPRAKLWEGTSWVIVSVVAHIVGLFAGKFVYEAAYILRLGVACTLVAALFGVVYGTITGGILMLLPQYSVPLTKSSKKRQVASTKGGVPNPLVLAGSVLVFVYLVLIIVTGVIGQPINGEEVARLYQARRHDLSGFELSGFDLSAVRLEDADLSGANLEGADLHYVWLWGSNLEEANLSRANLRGATLSCANLSNAHLISADLSRAHLTGADLSGADLTGVNLSGATVTNEQLAQVESLTGAIMPDGTIYKGEND